MRDKNPTIIISSLWLPRSTIELKKNYTLVEVTCYSLNWWDHEANYQKSRGKTERGRKRERKKERKRNGGKKGFFTYENK